MIRRRRSADSQGAVQVSPTGVALAAAAGTCYGVYTTAAKALLNQGVPALAAMAVTLSLGAVLLAPVLLVRGAEFTGVRPVAMLAWLRLGGHRSQLPGGVRSFV